MYIQSMYNGIWRLHPIGSFNNAERISDLTDYQLLEAIRIIEIIYKDDNPDVSCSVYLPDYNSWLDAASERGIIKIYSEDYITGRGFYNIEDNRHEQLESEPQIVSPLERERATRVEQYDYFDFGDDEDLDWNNRIYQPLLETEQSSSEREILIRSHRPPGTYLRQTMSLEND